MLLAARQAAASLLPSAGRSALVASLARGLTTAAPAAAAAASHGGESDSDAAPSPASNYILGSNTPVTKRLWERFRWTMDKLIAAPPRDPAVQAPKPPRPVVIHYPFSTDEWMREHYRNPWDEPRFGRILEDLDSLAGYVAFEHCELEGEAGSRPPLCVTASVEAIELHSSRLDLHQDMQMSGRVVWTGASSLDIRMELVQAGQLQLSALFTFVARDVLTNRAHPVTPLAPRTKQDRELFCERQRAADARRAARAASGGSSAMHRALDGLSPEAERWAEGLLAAAKTREDLPALAAADLLLMDESGLANTFTCMPQNRNVHGRVFGGFLMRRAFELAHSTAYLFAGSRPTPLEVEAITFIRPVSVADLMKMRSRVVHTWVSPANPAQGQAYIKAGAHAWAVASISSSAAAISACRLPHPTLPAQGQAYIKVEAAVTQPERRQSTATNSFDLIFSFDLERGPDGRPLPPKMVLPSTEQQALEVARLFGPGSGRTRHPHADRLAAGVL